MIPSTEPLGSSSEPTILYPIPELHGSAAVSACSAACAGVPVIPLRPGTKMPLYPTGEKHLEGALRSGAQVLDLTAERLEMYGARPSWGIVTGERLAVLDLDGGPAAAWLDDIVRQHPEVAHWRDATVQVRTARGVHLYGAVPAGVTITGSSGKLAPLLDVRGVGAFVVAPGSRHPSGTWYELDTDAELNAAAAAVDPDALRALFHDMRGEGDTFTVAEVAALTLPLPLLALLRDPPEDGPPTPTAEVSDTRSISTEEARRRFDGVVRKVQEADAGQGNATLAWAAGISAALGVDRAEAERELVGAIMTRRHAEDPRTREQEARRTIGSGWNWGRANPQSALGERAQGPGLRAAASAAAPLAPVTHAERLAREAQRATDRPPPPERGQSAFVDVAALLDGELTVAQPDGGAALSDGSRLFYRGAVNGLIGDPEAAKSLIALASGAAVLQQGGVLAYVDTDHNGPELVARFLLSLSVDREVLIDRLKFTQPDDREELLAAVDEIVGMVADHDPAGEIETFVVLDSIGENLGMFGASPNEDQGVIDANRATAAKLARAGCTVLTIDHLAKNNESRKFGATGSTAKKRAVDGALYRVQIAEGREFSPPIGGASDLLLVKDRRGGVRARGIKTGEGAARFELGPRDENGRQAGRFIASPPAVRQVGIADKLTADVEQLRQLDPPPRSRDDVRERLEWGTARAGRALKEWREQAARSGHA